MKIEEIINFEAGAVLSATQIGELVNALKNKTVVVPAWKNLEKEYDPRHHPVMNKMLYPDIVKDDGEIVKVTRVALDYQRLAVKRLAGLCFGLPVKRVYDLEDSDTLGHEIADVMEKVFKNVRIDSVNLDRSKELFASCEVMTLWYAQPGKNRYYGIDSEIKLRCMTLSPMKGDTIYPLFDEYGDLIALSVQYKRKVGKKSVVFFDAYTAERHIKLRNAGEWEKVEDEANALGKIPAIYGMRPTPAWEDTTPIVEEMEWAMSRNGNYLRENSRPLFVVFADEEIPFGNEPTGNSGKGKSILKYPQGSSAQYVTWTQAVESLKYHESELKQNFFSQLQLPDWSFENMKSVPMSGEAMRQMFIDAILKVKDESGRLIEFLDREVNVVKAFVKMMNPAWSEAVDALGVTCVITPCTVLESEAHDEEASGDKSDGKNVERQGGEAE